MAKTIPGGKYLSADKKTWHDANGNALIDEPVAQTHTENAVPDAAAPLPASDLLPEAKNQPDDTDNQPGGKPGKDHKPVGKPGKPK